MRGTRTVLASGFLALVLITGSSAPSAADDCLANPNGPTPQGQHWYYRIDHANNGRQCWYLRAEIGRVQKNVTANGAKFVRRYGADDIGADTAGCTRGRNAT